MDMMGRGTGGAKQMPEEGLKGKEKHRRKRKRRLNQTEGNYQGPGEIGTRLPKGKRSGLIGASIRT